MLQQLRRSSAHALIYEDKYVSEPSRCRYCCILSQCFRYTVCLCINMKCVKGEGINSNSDKVISFHGTIFIQRRAGMTSLGTATPTSGNSDLYLADGPGSNFKTHTRAAEGWATLPPKVCCPCCVVLGVFGGEGGVTGCLPDDCSVSPIMGCHLLSSLHKGKQCVCVWELVCLLMGVYSEEEGKGRFCRPAGSV